VARALTASFSGIAWPGVPVFVAAQLAALLVVAAIAGKRNDDVPGAVAT
jgi:hypothetical protein